mmetsp:Transcript_20188/g.51350  ORF Transcript_20188/g.51350 Transcript_20188/m.51350 type:complete len:203 (+) Transcript_20188:86-694(+)
MALVEEGEEVEAAASTVLTHTARTEFLGAMSRIAACTDPAKRAIILSGGVDTSAILAAARELGITFSCAVTVITGEDSPDRAFAQAVALEHGLEHHIVRVTSSELIECYLPACVRELATFDGMTLRNSLVIAAAMRKVRELGLLHAVVGDGADELFGGYSFMWGSADDPAAWQEKRDKMCRQWTFATSALAAAEGLTSQSPF